MISHRWRLISVLILSLIVAIVPAMRANAAEPVECWRGWGYRVDSQTRTYKSEELLLVTKGAANWQPGEDVALHVLDRKSGQIIPGTPPITITPFNPRIYYRNNQNYVDGEGSIAGSGDILVFGLNYIAPPTAAIEKLYRYNVWACGLEGVAG